MECVFYFCYSKKEVQYLSRTAPDEQTAKHVKLNNSALILIDRDGGNQFFYNHPSVQFWLEGFLFWFSLKREEIRNENDN